MGQQHPTLCSCGTSNPTTPRAAEGLPSQLQNPGMACPLSTVTDPQEGNQEHIGAKITKTKVQPHQDRPLEPPQVPPSPPKKQPGAVCPPQATGQPESAALSHSASTLGVGCGEVLPWTWAAGLTPFSLLQKPTKRSQGTTTKISELRVEMWDLTKKSHKEV
jgi:hypothetical protein